MRSSPRTECARRTTSIYIWREKAIVAWSRRMISVVACCHSAKRSFAHLLFELSDRNKMVLWPVFEGCAVWNLHKKNVRSVRFLAKRRGCCCNLSAGVALNARFTTNGMCSKNNTPIHSRWREHPIIEWSRRVISIIACCHSTKLCAHAAQAFRLQQLLCVTPVFRQANFDLC